MSPLPPGVLLLLLGWGTLVAVDLVTWPQAMYSRPVVAGAVAGVLAGDIRVGLAVGMVLELFALDVLPVGATRYPDFGPATVVAVATAAGTAWPARIGMAVLLGLVVASAGGWTMQRLRTANARALQARAAALAAGSSSAVRELYWGGIARDALRGLAVTATGLVAAMLLRTLPALAPEWEAAALAVAVGGGLVAAGGGAIRSAGRGRRFRLLLAGMLGGTALAIGTLAR